MTPGLGRRLARVLTALLATVLATGPSLLAAMLAAAAIAWAVELGRPPEPLPAAADGIVALTGGAERVATALRLLATDHAPILLVSGVGGSAAYADLVRRAGAGSVLRDPTLAARVTLGRSAASTYGNALETADWARAKRLHTLIVVTAWYHMPRALTELSRALPGVTLYPAPVLPPPLPGFAQWRLLADEYAKWLVAKAGLSRYADRGEARAGCGQLCGRHLLALRPVPEPALEIL